ncbi:MAG TPA: carboxypeptidase-like regulatory domain-containing protein, partial [Thermoanaerobaculia bacterium]
MLAAPAATSTWADTPSASAQAAVEVMYRLIEDATLPPSWDVLLQPSAAREGPAVRYPVKAGEPLKLQLAAGSSWEVSADLPGFWVRRKTLVVGRAGETSRLELDLWPLGKIAGCVKVQRKGVTPPREVLVKTVAAPALFKRPPMPAGALACPVDEEGNWSCSLPAATFDLAIAAEGFTPQYRWGIEVLPAKTRSLGTLQLERGGSLAAWVAVEGGTLDPAHAVARLSFLAACDTDVKAVLELDRIAVERPVSKDGFLQITGLAPGSYALEVRQPGLAPARVADVRIAPQEETFLPEPLLLTQPITLEFEITPPLDEWGEPWHAQVIRRAEDSRPAPFVYDGSADADGRFTVAEQSPGWFQVDVLDSKGNRVHSEPARQLDSSTRQSIQLHRIAVEGRLRLGSEPLAGTLWFGGQYGARRVKMEATEEGHFAGVL